MADITDPEAIRFINEVIRPLAEDARALFAKLQAADEVVNRILPTIGNRPTDLVLDGRAAEGVSQISGADIHGLAAIRTAMLGMATPVVQELISKVSVRPLNIS